MSKAGGEIFLKVAVCAEVELLPVGRVVVADDLDQSVRFEFGIAASFIVDMGIEKRGNFEIRALHLYQPVVNDRLRDAAGGEDGVELTALAQSVPVGRDVLHDGISVFVPLVLAVGNEVLDAGLINT